MQIPALSKETIYKDCIEFRVSHIIFSRLGYADVSAKTFFLTAFRTHFKNRWAYHTHDFRVLARGSIDCVRQLIVESNLSWTPPAVGSH